MQERMDADNTVKYWIDSSEFGQELVTVSKDHNFYWNKTASWLLSLMSMRLLPALWELLNL